MKTFSIKHLIAIIFFIAGCDYAFAYWGEFEVEGIRYQLQTYDDGWHMAPHYYPEYNFLCTHEDESCYCRYSWDTRPNTCIIIDADRNLEGDIVIPSSITYEEETYYITQIGHQAFSHCSKITSISLPEPLHTIGDAAFWSCTSLESVKLPNSIKHIESQAFLDCKKMTSIEMPYYISSIGGSAFRGCKELKSITLYSLEELGDGAFYECENIETIYIRGNISTIGSGTFQSCKKLKNLTLPDTFTSIGWQAFANCENLTSFYIPSSVTEIEEEAFSGCDALTSITIPASVTKISYNPFIRCDKLSNIKVSYNNTVYDSRGCNAIFEKETNTLVSGCLNTVIPNSCSIIGDFAFYGSNIKSINIPNSIKRIESHAFAQCSKLETINFPDSLVYIGKWAFNGSFPFGSKASIKLPISLQKVDDHAFDFAWFGVLEIYSSKTEFGLNAIDGSSYTDIYNYSITPQKIGYIGNGLLRLHVLKGYLDTYATSGWEYRLLIDDLDFPDNNKIYADDIIAKPGKRCTIPIKMCNENDVAGFQFDITLPEGITILTDEYGDEMIELSTDRTTLTNHTLSCAKIADNTYRVVALSLNNSTFSGNEGTVLNLNVKINENMELGKCYITFANEQLSTADLKTCDIAELKSRIELITYTDGDLTGDEKVTIADAIGVVNFILGNDTEGLNPYAADVNLDGEINVADAVGIVNLILYGQTTPANAKNRAVSKTKPASVTSGEFTITAGETKDLELYLDMPSYYSGIQFDLRLSEGLSLVENGIVCDSKHIFSSSANNDNCNKIVCYSFNNATFNNKNIVTLKIKANNDMPAEELVCNIENITLATTKAVSEKVPDISIIAHTNATSIYATKTGTNISDMQYDVNGRVVKTNSASADNVLKKNNIYIINGQKILKNK